MERISRKKRKRRVSTNKVKYAAAIIALVILALFLILVNYTKESEKEVTIKKIGFIDIGNDVYVKFDIKNPTDEQKSCLLNIAFADKRYGGYVNISAKSKKSYKTLVDMPFGKTEVRLDYICS